MKNELDTSNIVKIFYWQVKDNNDILDFFSSMIYTVGQSTTCKVCGLTARNKEELQDHINSAHKDSTWVSMLVTTTLTIQGD